MTVNIRSLLTPFCIYKGCNSTKIYKDARKNQISTWEILDIFLIFEEKRCEEKYFNLNPA
jgi:hypothetical protein